MKQKIIQQLHKLIYEHETSNYCISYDKAIETIQNDLDLATNQFYDCGRYDTLKEVLQIVKAMEV